MSREEGEQGCVRAWCSIDPGVQLCIDCRADRLEQVGVQSRRLWVPGCALERALSRELGLLARLR